MPKVVDFENVSTAGLESSPVATALAGLRANEARYFMNKYKHAFTVEAASDSHDTLDYVNRILKAEREIEFAATTSGDVTLRGGGHPLRLRVL